MSFLSLNIYKQIFLALVQSDRHKKSRKFLLRKNRDSYFIKKTIEVILH